MLTSPSTIFSELAEDPQLNNKVEWLGFLDHREMHLPNNNLESTEYRVPV